MHMMMAQTMMETITTTKPTTVTTGSTIEAAATTKFYNFSKVGYDDVLHIPSLSLESFLENLKLRYFNGVYYTYIGEVCVSVNPNKSNVNIYGQEYMEIYYEKHYYEMPPHIFAISDAAYRETFENNKNSCIIITGESGSGKTEASKLMMLFITHILRKDEHLGQSENNEIKISNVENILLNCNCILEAFGNAKTIRNKNSSRFGKYIEICFSRRNSLALNYISNDVNQFTYGVIHNYLLEKSRVIEQQEGERNFHVFYHLLASVDESDYSGSLLSLVNNVKLYNYLNASSQSIVTGQDGMDYKNVLDAMITVGFSSEQRTAILNVLAAILHLGNVDFDFSSYHQSDSPLSNETDYTQFIVPHSWNHFEYFCRLLSLEQTVALETLCKRKIRTPTEDLNILYNKTEAVYGRDALAKALYERLFKFILDNINISLQKSKPSNPMETNIIGILDIYGFEVFNTQPNGFEQFLINYCNEKLHQLFVDLILYKEQILYEKEDIDWQMVAFDNNLSICKLMDAPHTGIFAFLDEACTSGQHYTDRSVLKVFHRKFATNVYFRSRILHPSLRQLRPETDFMIRHYAGDVCYSIEGFMDKNMDKLYVDYKELMFSSSSPYFKEMWLDAKSITNLANKRPVTAGYKFRLSMADLMNRLGSNQQFYVRCIKPNDDFVDENHSNVNQNISFSLEKIRHQVQYLGLVENAQVRKAGFWRQMPYLKFIGRYQMLCPQPGLISLTSEIFQKDIGDYVETIDLRSFYVPFCKNILANSLESGTSCNSDKENDKSYEAKHLDKFAFGKSMIFLREPMIIESLERRRFNYLNNIILEIQTHARYAMANRRFARLKLAKLILHQFHKIRMHQFADRLLQKLENYENSFVATCRTTPQHLLEYFHLDLFQWPSDLLESHILLQICPFLTKQLPYLVNYLNNWLIIATFPIDYWREKLCRVDAYKIFRDNKVEWGQTKRRWTGNYLLNFTENPMYVRYQELFKSNHHIFHSAKFASFIVKTNSYNLDRICAIVMTERDIFKIEMQSLTCQHWVRIDEVDGISLTPGKDQLVVLHTVYSGNDLVFAFCSLKESLLSISTTQLALENGGQQCCTKNYNAKVGEFVTLFTQQYQKLTNRQLNIMFCNGITFKFNHEENYIEVIDSDQAYEELLSRFVFRVRSFFTLKKFRQFYFRYILQNETRSNNQNRLAHRSEFEKISSNKFVLISDC